MIFMIEGGGYDVVRKQDWIVDNNMMWWLFHSSPFRTRQQLHAKRHSCRAYGFTYHVWSHVGCLVTMTYRHDWAFGMMLIHSFYFFLRSFISLQHYPNIYGLIKRLIMFDLIIILEVWDSPIWAVYMYSAEIQPTFLSIRFTLPICFLA